MNKIVKILIAVMLLATLLVGCNKKSQFEGLASKLEAINNGDFSELQDNAPEAYWEYLKEKNDMDVEDRIEQREEDFEDNTADSREESYGKNWEYSISVDDEKKLEDDEIEDIAEALNARYDIDEEEVTSAYRVWLYIKVEGDDDRSHAIGTYTAVKISGDWYLCSVYDYGDQLDVSFIGV